MVESLIAWLIVGAIAGWLAGLLVKGFGFGLIGNIVVVIIGAVIAGWLLPRLGIALGSGMVAAIINAVIGAVILLVVIGLIRRATYIVRTIGTPFASRNFAMHNKRRFRAAHA